VLHRKRKERMSSSVEGGSTGSPSAMDDMEMFMDDWSDAKIAKKRRRRRVEKALNKKSFTLGTQNVQDYSKVKLALRRARTLGIAVMAMQEVKGVAMKNSKFSSAWRLWSSGADSKGGAGVMFAVSETFLSTGKVRVDEVQFLSARVGIMKVSMERRKCTIVNVYAKFHTQQKEDDTGDEEEDLAADDVFETIWEMTKDVPREEIVLMGDFNGHISYKDWTEYEHPTQLLESERGKMRPRSNKNGIKLLDVCKALDLVLTSMCVQEKWDNVCTYHGFNRKYRTLIDYIAVPRALNHRSKRAHTEDAFATGSDHKMVVLKYWVEDRAKSKKRREPQGNEAMETELEQKLRLLLSTAVPRPWFKAEEVAWCSLDTEIALMRLNSVRGTTDKQQLKDLKNEVKRLRRRDNRFQMELRAEKINHSAIRKGASAVMKLISPMSFKRRKRSTVCLSRKERTEVHKFFVELYTKREVPEFKEWDVPQHANRPELPQHFPWVNWHVETKLDFPLQELANIAAVRMENGKAVEIHRRLASARTEGEAAGLGILWALQLSTCNTKVRIYTSHARSAAIARTITHHRAQDFSCCESPQIWEHVYCEDLTRVIDIQLVKCAPLPPLGSKIAKECITPESRVPIPNIPPHNEEAVMKARGEGPEPWKKLTVHYAASNEAPTYAEVEAAVKRLKGGAAGADGVTKDTIIQVEIQQIFDILQTVWVTREIPKIWKLGIQIQIPKSTSGDGHITDKLRGITLTSNVSKILTSIMYYRACGMDLDDALFGFRPGRGTDTPVLLVKKAIRDAVRGKKRRYLLFVDYSRMYDSLDRTNVWPLLLKFGFGETSVALLQKLYEDELLIQVGPGDLRSTKPTRGVRQGCLLSPMIANVAMCAAYRAAVGQMKGVIVEGVTLTFISYADDVVLFADSEDDLAQAWKALEEATKALGLSVNTKKTKLMEVTSGHKRMRTTAGGYRAAQKKSGHFREREEDIVTMPKLRWADNMEDTWLCVENENNPLRCPECSGDCGAEFYPDKIIGAAKYKYTAGYRLAKHIKEVHFKGLNCMGSDMTGRSCLVRDMSVFASHSEIILRDPRKNGEPRVSGVLGVDRQIEVVESFKYLGVMLSNDGIFGDEINHRIREAWKAFAALRSILVSKRLKRHTKVGIWKTYVMSALLSGAATWTPGKEQEELVERTMHKQLRSILNERKYKDAAGQTRTPSRERIRQVAGVAPVADILRERRLHATRNIISMKSVLAKVVLSETWWSGYANPMPPLQQAEQEDDRECLVDHLFEQFSYVAPFATTQALSRFRTFCLTHMTNAMIIEVAAKVHEGERPFVKEVRKWIRKSWVQEKSKPDWGLLSRMDMEKCDLIVSDAQVMSRWNERCECYKALTNIPYEEEPEPGVISEFEEFQVAWTDGAVGDVSKVASFAVVEGRWRDGKLLADKCDYNVVVGAHTNNRGELSAVLKALQRGRRVKLMLVIDSEIAIRGCLGCQIKNNSDLCDRIMAEVRARTLPLRLVKVWSHPLRKRKPVCLLNVGNEMVDALAGYATKIKPEDRPEKLSEIFKPEPREAPKGLRGEVRCFKAEQIARPLKKLRTFTGEEVIELLGDRGRPK